MQTTAVLFFQVVQLRSVLVQSLDMAVFLEDYKEVLEVLCSLVRLKNILNMDPNIDMVGRADQTSVGSFSIDLVKTV